MTIEKLTSDRDEDDSVPVGGRPYAARDAASYWGGGVLAEDRGGGWWSLHAVATPAGVETYSVGRDGRRDGWPTTLRRRHVFAAPDDGGARCICLD